MAKIVNGTQAQSNHKRSEVPKGVSGYAHELHRPTADEYARADGGPRPRRSGKGYSITCPAHDDKHNSASVCDGENGGLVFHCFAGCTQDQVLEAVRGQGVDPSGPRKPSASSRQPRMRPVEWYEYRDEAGAILYRNVRRESHDANGRRIKKSFFQQRPHPTLTDKWINDLEGVRRVPYRLPELIRCEGQDIHCTEGEKDADRLATLGLCATSVSDPNTVELVAFKDRNVFIHEDNDEKGRATAAALASALSGIASSVRIVCYVDTDEGEDVSNWLNQDKSRGLEDVLQRCKEAQSFAVPPKGAPDDSGQTTGNSEGSAPKQANVLIELAQSGALFHTPDGTGYADFEVNGHRETWPIRSRGFRKLIDRAFYEHTGGAPSSEARQSALSVIEAKALFDAPERPIHMRVGELNGRFYLDLCDETWRAIEVDHDGWRVIDSPPIRFRRTAGMRPLPVPTSGGSINALRSFLNVKNDADFVLLVAWMLGCLRNRGPYPVLVLLGEQGSAKSTLVKLLRRLLDPNTAPLRSLPRDERDLFIAANNGHLLAFDNVSGLPAWLSDALCRLATGAGFATRQLHTDQDEVIFVAARPAILNGIEDIVTRPDLADRAVFLTQEPISEEQRRPEQELWSEFETASSQILGALLDAIACGLRNLQQTRLERLPRMADFALWATACETVLWPAGTFCDAYDRNRDDAVESVIEADPVAVAVREFMRDKNEWTGTASELLDVLGAVAGEARRKTKTWPNSSRALSNRLRRAATFLRKVEIQVEFQQRTGRRRPIRITATPEHDGSPLSQPSPSSHTWQKSNGDNRFAADDKVTADGDGNAHGDDEDSAAVTTTITDNLLKSISDDADDADDASIAPQSGVREYGAAPASPSSAQVANKRR